MCVIGKVNIGVGVMPGRAVMSEQGVQEGTEQAPLRGSCVEDQCSGCVIYPYHPGGGIQLQMEVFSPRVLSLLMSFEGSSRVITVDVEITVLWVIFN